MSSPSPSHMESMTQQEQEKWLEEIRKESIYNNGSCLGKDGDGCYFRGRCRFDNVLCPKREEELEELHKQFTIVSKEKPVHKEMQETEQ